MTANGTLKILCFIVALSGVLLSGTAHGQNVFRVDDDAGPGGDGLSWPSAFNDLQLAIEEAANSFGPDLIKVARGKYTPSVPSAPPEAATFTLDFLDVTIEGGYAGISDPMVDPDLRDPENFVTVLSGALPATNPPAACGGPGTIDCFLANPGVLGCEDLSCCEVVCADIPLCCELPLGWIQGCADIAIDLCLSVGVDHVVTIENVDPSVRIDGLTITRGADTGMLVRDADPFIVACTFMRNRGGQGGALRFKSSNLLLMEPFVTNCSFRGNDASSGGAVSAVGTMQGPFGNPPAQLSAPLFVNCVFSGNTANEGGGIFAGGDSRVTLANCTLNSNTGSGAFVSTGGIGGAGTLFVTNSILWNNVPSQIDGPATVNFSDVQGGFDGDGNISGDPRFEDEFGSDGILGTADDDVRLDLVLSPANDAGTNTHVPPDRADLDGDGDVVERTPFDVAFAARFGLAHSNAPSACAARVDMGAFENADCQPNEIRDEDELMGNDANGDGIPDDCQDCNENGTLDSIDISQNASDDCNGNGVPDECDVDVVIGCSLDADMDGVPDECQIIWQLRQPFMDPRTGESGIEGAAASVINGKIYVSHGNRSIDPSNPNDTKLLSIYDISADTWDHTAPVASVVRSELAGGTAGGKHYAIGGRRPDPAAPHDEVEEFDPATNAWLPKDSLNVARGGVGAASWQDKIYAIGGRSGESFGSGLMIFNTNEVYDPGTNMWTFLAPLPTGNEVSDNYATMALDGKIYVFGGATSELAVTTALQIYDIARNTWASGPPVPTPRAAAMAGVVDGKIAVFGGFDPFPTANANLAVTEIFDPATSRWFPGPRMFQPTSEMAQGVTWDNNGIFAIGSGIFGVSQTVVQRLVPRSACLADLDRDCSVGIVDFLALLAAWGPCPATPAPCLADFDGDGNVGVVDFLFLLATWGPCQNCQSQQSAPPLEESIESTGLAWPIDWDLFVGGITKGNQAEQANWVCWMIHYLEGCDGLLCIPPDCPGPDPFSDPPIMHEL